MSVRTLVLAALVASAAFLAVAPAYAPGVALAFSAPVTLPSSTGHAEPSVEVAADGTVYVVAPQARTSVWRSTDDAATFTRVADSKGSSGDSDVATDANGRLYVSDLFSNVPVSISTNQGTSFSSVVSTASGGSNDRQWLAAHGNGKAWSAWRDGSTERVARTTNGGLTWSTPVVAATSVTLQGNIVASSDTDLWIPYSDGGSMRLAKSTDGGVTWTQHTVAIGNGDVVLFPAVAVDAAGKVYVAWARGNGNVDSATQIRVARSDDGGSTWTIPTILSTTGHYNIFPWITAGAQGRVAIAWYEGTPPAGTSTTDPNFGTLTTWTVHVAHSIAADTATPAWEHALATGVFHTGPICTFGTLCFPVNQPAAFNRVLLDFFEIDVLDDGNLVIAYAADNGVSGSVLKVVKQTAGNIL